MKADIKKKSWRCQIESLTIYFQVLENKNEPNPKATNGAKKRFSHIRNNETETKETM